MQNLFYLLVAESITIVTLIIVLFIKMERIRSLQETVENFKKMLEEMDAQAKLIVRTDLELNKTQEELDKKLNGLYALQKISRNITTTLEESQIFNRIDNTTLKELGFEKAACFLWQESSEEFRPCLFVGYLEENKREIVSFVAKEKVFFLELVQKQKLLSSLTKDKTDLSKEIVEIFSAPSFVIAPLVPKEGNKGFFFAGSDNPDFDISEGDEELFSIMVNELGQALDNARLFEKTWKAQADLEKKVVERTRELTRALQELEIISKRKSEFISAVSHELRTPLTSIKGYASILLTGALGILPEQAKARIEKINKHSDELTQLVNELLDIARIESGKIVMKKEKILLEDLVLQVTDLLGIQMKEKNIEFTKQIASDANMVFADREQLKRVFINLLNNAIKFTPPKGKINLVAKKIDSTIQIDITDTGCGIPKESLEKIFEEFYRVDNPTNEKIKGTGLGLSLVKHIVEAHSGKIWVESKVDYGSTFSFTLPYHE